MTDADIATRIVEAAAEAMTNYVRSPNSHRGNGADQLLDEATIGAACSLRLQLAGQISLTEVNWLQLVQLFNFHGVGLKEPLPGRQRLDILVLDREDSSGVCRPRMVVEIKKDARPEGLKADIQRIQQIIQAHNNSAIQIAGLQVLTVAFSNEGQRTQTFQMLRDLAAAEGLLDDDILRREFAPEDTENGNVVFYGVYALPFACRPTAGSKRDGPAK